MSYLHGKYDYVHVFHVYFNGLSVGDFQMLQISIDLESRVEIMNLFFLSLMVHREPKRN